LKALRDRNSLQNAEIEDVMFGCVEPVDDQGAYNSIAFAAPVWKQSISSQPQSWPDRLIWQSLVVSK
jgi:acetyl-CoA acetyltransferase